MGIEIEVEAGRHIEAACLDAVGIALTTGQDVTFVFNGTPMTITPEDSAASARNRWWEKRWIGPLATQGAIPPADWRQE